MTFGTVCLIAASLLILVTLFAYLAIRFVALMVIINVHTKPSYRAPLKLQLVKNPRYETSKLALRNLHEDERIHGQGGTYILH
jgi:hypothetical protein